MKKQPKIKSRRPTRSNNAVARECKAGSSRRDGQAFAVPRARADYNAHDGPTFVLLLVPFLLVAVSLGAWPPRKPAVPWPVAILASAPAPEVARERPAVDSPIKAEPPPAAATGVLAAAPALAPVPELPAANRPGVSIGEAAEPQVCAAKPERTFPASPVDQATFGSRLAAAARAQTEDFVVYTARYKRIAFPLGDLPPFYGACTDVVIRAYRALGVDLQGLVQRARVGRGDPSIDHRRTETLRIFFRRHGQSLPISEFPEDYRPGDIVTYERPFGRASRAHIAVVSDVTAATGRPMIVHNRGWGPQLEDALFVDRITGHYRFAGSGAVRPATVANATPATRLAHKASLGRDSR